VRPRQANRRLLHPRNSVPLNNAARRADGLPEDPNEPTGAGYDDYVFEQMVVEA
jgi:hypothetical protein